MKKELRIGILTVLIVALIGSVSASLCMNSNGYYEDCSKVKGYYYDYDNYYDGSNYAYGQMDSCRDSRGNYYPCYKQYRTNPNYDDEDYYDGYYYTYRNEISTNYRDVYGNYVTEIRPDYTLRYCEDDWNLPWHLRTSSNCYSDYDLIYNNPYYPDIYVSYNSQQNNNQNKVIVYIR
ncbi:MAG: hypothetical protein WC979_06835 [Candidatus Pacearchaeota archaeon]|jgi:hypothetical protein